MESSNKNHELKNNINREEEIETAEKIEGEKELKDKKEKFGGGDSHIDGSETEAQGAAKAKPELQKDEEPEIDQDHAEKDPPRPQLRRKDTKEQQVEVDNKSHLDEEEG